MYNVWDVETTTAYYMKRKASPFHPDNFVVASGWKRKGNESATGEYYGRGKRPFDWFTKLLKDTRFLVGFNIKFDLLYALKEPQNLEAWMEYVADGGNVWDCQLAEHLLRGMEPDSHMMSMDDCVMTYGGNLKIDEVKALWEAGVDTLDIDEDLLMRYLIGDESGLGDIGNTEKIFLGQMAKARASGQIKSIVMNMGSLLCSTEMERNGMFVDKPLGLKVAAELEVELAGITANLRQYLPEVLDFDFNWSNRYHLSPLIFGGKIKYEKRVPILTEDGKQAYVGKQEKHVYIKSKKSTTTDAEGKVKITYGTMPYDDWVTIDHQPEPLRFTGGKQAGELKTVMVTVPDLTKPKSHMKDFYHEFPGVTEPKDAWKSSTPGLWSTKEEVITELGIRNIPFLKTLARVASLNKDLGTYYIRLDPKTNEYKGMLTLVGIDSIIHHSINHSSTVTARFSSSNPNLQNISKGEFKTAADGSSFLVGSQIKMVFVSRFGADGQIVQDDFTALEVYIQALLTNCKQLLEDLALGLDMHCVRVGQKEGISYDEAVLRCKGDAEYRKTDGQSGKGPWEGWAKKRTEAKVFSFQRAYGAGAKKISDSTGMAIEDVEALIKAEEERYPELAAYNAAKELRIKASRKATSIFVPHPEVPGLNCQLGKGISTTPDGKVYSYRESPAPAWLIKRGGMAQSFSPTEIANYEVQGAGGEWAKAAMWLAVRAFYKAKNFGGLALLVNQVHDALYADCHKDKLVVASATLHAAMLESNTFMEWYFGWTVKVPVPAVCSHGDNMMQEKGYDDTMKPLAEKIRRRLRELYMGGYTPSFETI